MSVLGKEILIRSLLLKRRWIKRPLKPFDKSENAREQKFFEWG